MNAQRIQTLQQFIKETPEDPFNYYALAMEYYDGAPDKATELLSQLLQEHPSYLPTYFQAAHLYWDTSKWEQAEDTFLKGIRLAEEQNETKALSELKSSYQNFLFDKD